MRIAANRLTATLVWAAFIGLLGGATASRGDMYTAPDATLEWLGRGFDSYSEFPKNPCLQGDVVNLGNNFAEMRYRGGQTVHHYREETFGKIKGSINLVIFSGSASVEMMTRITENESTAASVLQLDYNGQNLSLENRSLTDLGRQMLNQPAEIRRRYCGDEFVHHLKLGARLYVTARLHFRSREKYEKYKTTIKVRVLFFKKKKTITEEFKKYTEDAVYSIKVVAQGGMTERLRQILDSNPAYCRTDNMDACIATTGLLFDYLFAQGEFGTAGYADDVKSTDLNVLSVSTQNYADSGHFSLASDTGFNYDPGFNVLEKKLQQELVENAACSDRMTAFLAVEEDDTVGAQYQEQINKANENIGFIKNAVNICKREPEFSVCNNAVENALEDLHQLDCD